MEAAACLIQFLLVLLSALNNPLSCRGMQLPDNYNCGPGVHTPGVTIPKGDIIVEEGLPLEILCMLDPNHPSFAGRNSSWLVFYHGDRRMPEEFVNIVDAMTLRLYVAKPPPSNSMYYCKLRGDSVTNAPEEAVCLNSVAIGHKPQEPTDFSCESHNWENLTCTWTPPHNYVKTSYNLMYYLPGRIGARFENGCPGETDIRENRCFWDDKTTPIYRPAFKYYHFNITGSNPLGTISRKIQFHHFAHVIPARAANLTLIDRSVSSATIKWFVGFPMQNFPPGVVQMVEYQSQWDPRDKWQVMDTSSLNIKSSVHTLNVTGLRYANSLYDIRVIMRSSVASGEGKWSEPAKITVKTLPTVPSMPPRTDIGSFETIGSSPTRDIYLYWQQIPQYCQNGDGFEYEIILVDGSGDLINIIPDERTNAYAKFINMRDDQRYHFKIYSSNQEGLSESSSEIIIPNKTESALEPESFTKILFGNRIYELSWKAPQNPGSDLINNYSIFWCDNKRDRPFQCTGYLDWETVVKNFTVLPNQYQTHNITVPTDEVYQFAISSNSVKGSSGMVWAACTVIYNKVVEKMKNRWVNRIGSTFMELGWRLDCSDRIGVIVGYQIYYCPIASPFSQTCKDEELNVIVAGDAMMMHCNLTGLKPYTTYLVRISVLTKNGEGLKSEPLNNTTLESAPENPPENVFVEDVSNTSIVISWKEPPELNGVLRYYEVYFNESKTNAGKENLIKLENLDSFVNYSISVSACTIACSQRSLPVLVQTDIGVPSQMEPPYVRFINSSQVLVSWSPPLHPSGAIDSYEVRVGVNDGINEPFIFNYSSTGLEYQIPIPHCDDDLPHKVYKFEVRAVNKGSSGEVYAGDWSLPGEGNCYASGPSAVTMSLIVILIVLFVAVLCIAFGYLGKRIWSRCKEMQDIDIKMPSTLFSPNDDTEGKIDAEVEYHLEMHSLQNWPSAPRPLGDGILLRHYPPADEELLLQRKVEEQVGKEVDSEDCDGEVDVERGSSGCSGCSTLEHASISSSHSSERTQFLSDSGTEVNQRSPSPGVVFSDLPSPPISSLRLRNVRNGGSSQSEPYICLANNISSPNSNYPRNTPSQDDMRLGYSVVGSNVGASGYVTLPPVKPPPVVSSGYVPWAVAASSDTNKDMEVAVLSTATTPATTTIGTTTSPTTTNAAATNTITAPTTATDTTATAVASPAQTPTVPLISYVMAGESAESSDESYCQLGWDPETPQSQRSWNPVNPQTTSNYVPLPASNASSAGYYVPHRQLDKNDTMGTPPSTNSSFIDDD